MGARETRIAKVRQAHFSRPERWTTRDFGQRLGFPRYDRNDALSAAEAAAEASEQIPDAEIGCRRSKATFYGRSTNIAGRAERRTRSTRLLPHLPRICQDDGLA